MSNYTKSTNFATKDNLTPGDPLKVVRGTEIDTEYNNIATAIATKTDNSAAAITGGSITGITDLAIADGGTGASTATAAINNLLPAQTSAANKYLQSDGTNVSWDAVTLSTSDITGTLAVANGGTGVTSSTGTGNVVLSNSPTLVTPALGTPVSGVATNLTGLPISTGVSGLGTGVATFLGTPSSANLASAVSDETGSGALVFANSPTLVTPTLGTPASATLTNATGLPISTGVSGLGTGVATFLATPSSANLRSALTDETGTGSAVFATSPALVTPDLGTPSAATLTNATGLPISTGVSGLGSGVATFLATPSSDNLRSALTDETGTGSAVFATSPTLVTPILGTPQSGNFSTGTFTWPTFNQNTTGTAAGLSATLATTSGGTGLTSFTSGGVVYASSTSALATGSGLVFNGANLGLNVTPSAWGGDYKALQINNSGIVTNTGGTFIAVASNAYFDGTSYRYVSSAAASLYRQNAGEHNWNIAASGTAGATFTFTQAMTLDAAGDFLVGTTTAPSNGANVRNVVFHNPNSVATFVKVSNAATGATASDGFDLIMGTSSDAYVVNRENGPIIFFTNGTEGARFPSTGGLQGKTTISVGDATPSTSGAGITFPATVSLSSNANTLDDYEEGTWTPSFTLDSGSATLNSASGNYVKVGKQVTLTMTISFSSATAALINTITGLPFAAEDVDAIAVGAVRENGNTGFMWQLRPSRNTTTANIRKYDNTQVVAAGDQFIGTVTYFTSV